MSAVSSDAGRNSEKIERFAVIIVGAGISGIGSATLLRKPVAGVPVSHEEVMQGFEHIHPLAQQIIKIGQDWKKWVLCDREPIMNWTDGNVALLGDAAHPMMQYLAQGACMAMEDSVILSVECGKTPDDLPGALRRYQDRRRLRTARVQLQAREVGNHIYHPDGAHAALRNQIMQAKTPEQWYDVVDWMYAAEDVVAATSAAKRSTVDA